ncbi:MAG: bifunctional alpha,alpha-trehalose-phosphate synthase (UDP-forming)/trehalose-phosphatase [Phycisphaeraceae bacterium]
MSQTPNKRIINVSNRLPVRIAGNELVKSSGGLVSALEGVQTSGGGDFDLQWIGWPGGAAEDMADKQGIAARLKDEFGYHPVFLSDDEIDDFYHGFSNSSLWPLLHYNPTYFKYQYNWWETYEKINGCFADVVCDAAEQGDLVWVHDYHLMLLPKMLRERRPDLRVGFFLHTPFPSYEIFRCHPRRNQLLEGLLGADLIGFHTFGYLRHFRSAVLRLTGRESDVYTIRHDDAETHISVFPIGINWTGFEQELQSERFRECRDRLSNDYKNKRIVLSVERLDYSKGIPKKLEAIEKYLDANPDRRDDVEFILIAVPSREDVDEYAQLKQTIELAVSQINGKFATITNIPVHFINRGVKFEELCALYSIADVAMVTPLVDGMNLVAKEYVACQQDHGGVLILSEFAGAAQELFNAVMVNPYDVDGMAWAVGEALDMDDAHKRSRMEPMRKLVIEKDSKWWARRFVDALVSSTSQPPRDAVKRLDDRAIARFAPSDKKKALFLDYDGTLRGFTLDPAEATPQPVLLDALAELDKRDDLDIYVVSGRKGEFLQEHLGQFGFTLIGEHGYAFKRAGGDAFELLNADADLSWMPTVREVFDLYAASTPGTHVEQKRSALVWHYRAADPEFGVWKAIELIGHLKEAIANVPAAIAHGKKIVEVSSQQINKGMAVERFIHETKYDAVLCIGDDQTDETMFRHRNSGAVTIKVGPGTTDAEYRVPGPDQVHAMLATIAGMKVASSV